MFPLRRNFSTIAIKYQKTRSAKELDPIQKLFIDKIRDYSSNKQKAGKLLYDASPEMEKRLDDSLTKLKVNYSADQEDKDLTKFPKLVFKEPQLDPINLTNTK